MKGYIGITDGDWFNFLSKQPEIDEVNFWQPGGRSIFKALSQGEPFFFKLHSPLNYIVGGGFFAHHSILPISLSKKPVLFDIPAPMKEKGELTTEEFIKKFEVLKKATEEFRIHRSQYEIKNQAPNQENKTGLKFESHMFMLLFKNSNLTLLRYTKEDFLSFIERI